MYGDVTTTSTIDPAATGAMAAFAGFMIAYFFVIMIIAVLLIIAQWKIFKKAGKPGWAAIIPIYNVIVLLEIIGKPIWWLVLLFVPVANMVIGILMALELGRKFGKSDLFSVVGLVLFPVVGYPMLAFGSAQYIGATATPAVPTAPAAAEVPTDPANL